MELLLGWPLIGAVIGYIAATKRGFAPVVGILVGALLGVFSIVLLVFGDNSKMKKCPACLEWIDVRATACKHCHSNVA